MNTNTVVHASTAPTITPPQQLVERVAFRTERRRQIHAHAHPGYDHQADHRPGAVEWHRHQHVARHTTCDSRLLAPGFWRVSQPERGRVPHLYGGYQRAGWKSGTQTHRRSPATRQLD